LDLVFSLSCMQAHHSVLTIRIKLLNCNQNEKETQSLESASRNLSYEACSLQSTCGLTIFFDIIASSLSLSQKLAGLRHPDYTLTQDHCVIAHVVYLRHRLLGGLYVFNQSAHAGSTPREPTTAAINCVVQELEPNTLLAISSARK